MKTPLDFLRATKEKLEAQRGVPMPIEAGSIERVFKAVEKASKGDPLTGMVLLSNVCALSLYAWTDGCPASAMKIMRSMIDQVFAQVKQHGREVSKDDFYAGSYRDKKTTRRKT